jgi:dienelactone hydrolase
MRLESFRIRNGDEMTGRIPIVVVAFTVTVAAAHATSVRKRDLTTARRGISQTASLAPEPDLESLKRLFAYQKNAPLNVKSSIVSRQQGAIIAEISFESPKGGRVDGYIVEPASVDQRRPGIVFGHWGPGNRTEFLPEALLYARAGAICVLTNYPWTRPLEWRREFGYRDGQADLDLARQAVVDLRRAFDVLLDRRDVDPGRIAYIGHSYGAQWGAILSAVDKRMKISILIGGVRASDDIWEKSNAPESVNLRREWPPEIRAPYIKRYTAVDGVRYVPYAAPVALYFQFAQFERLFDAESMNAYFEAASQPKTVKWYPTGHDLNDPHAWADRARWLAQQIGVKNAPSVLQTSVSGNDPQLRTGK